MSRRLFIISVLLISTILAATYCTGYSLGYVLGFTAGKAKIPPRTTVPESVREITIDSPGANPEQRVIRTLAVYRTISDSQVLWQSPKFADVPNDRLTRISLDGVSYYVGD